MEDRRALKRCDGCGYEATMKRKQRFCSRECAAIARRTLPQQRCAACSREFHPRTARQRFCSTKCALIGRAPPIRECPQCAIRFSSRSASQRFCSPRCANRWHRERRLAQRSSQTRTCEVCEVTFPGHDRRRRFCSRKCQLAALRQRNRRRCELCGTEFGFVDRRRRFCSRRCGVLGSKRYRGEQAYNWKGGRTAAPRDYVKVRSPGHPRASKNHPYVLEHILVMERLLGRYLLPNERVHHLNGRRDDDRPENLELWKVPQPAGIRAADYHCPGCRCGRATTDELTEPSPLAES